MKSKQSLFKEILDVSTKKVRQRSIAGAKDQFELRMKNVPQRINQLNADPYMFIFDALIEFPEQVDFTLTQYQNMLQQNFLNIQKHSSMIVKHFRKNLQQHSFRIIQILMDIRQPNLQIMQLFFEIHNSIQMAENVLQSFRYTGYRWMARAFCFHKCSKPRFVEDLTTGILKSEDRNLPCAQDQHHSRQKYIHKMLNQMVLTIENNLKPQREKVQSKYGFCFMCLQPANFYCKDTKISVCCSDCKKAHIAYIANNHSINFQYNQKFRWQIQKLLVNNLRKKKNMALSIDYLCSIYMNSDYFPKQNLPHQSIIRSPVIIERVWVLYVMYYLRRNEVFQHIFADCLTSKIDYVYINSAKYFMRIVEDEYFCQVYEHLDYQGFRRIVPIILANLHDKQLQIKFIHNIIDTVFKQQDFKILPKVANQLKQESSLNFTMLRAINHNQNPLQKFKQQYGEQNSVRQMVKCIIKNEQLVNKSKACQIVISNNKVCHAFLKQLLVEPINPQDSRIEQYKNAQVKQQYYLKTSPYLDEILREVLYFLNTKLSQKIYSLITQLDSVLNSKKLCPNPFQSWGTDQLCVVFSQENISSPNTLFQVSYLIIMVVTELSHKQKQKPTQASFLKRVQDFDSKFATINKNYLVGLFHRLVDFPMSQQSRGIMCCYPAASKQHKNQRFFHPVSILLDNWQEIHEIMSNNKSETDIIYRICKCLIDFPNICERFFELLLAKLCPSNSFSYSGLEVTIQNAKKDNLLDYINNIMQQQPNCVGNGSWKYLFARDPNPIQISKPFIFGINSLIHYSKSLTFSNFIWFVRQFCSNVKLSQNLNECLELLSSNMMLSNSLQQIQAKQFKDRMQILTKQMIQPHFYNDKQVYFQIQFMKGVFSIGCFELGVRLLDYLPVNMVSERLIIFGLTDIVTKNWVKIEQYGDSEIKKLKQKEQLRKKQDQTKKQQLLEGPLEVNILKSQKLQDKPQQTLQIPLIWQHILTKVKTVSLSNAQLLEPFSLLLRSIDNLRVYFQILNIEYAIESAFSGISYPIDPMLRTQLSKFQHHIPQMYTAKFSISQIRKDQEHQQYGLLEQFVNVENLFGIIKHWKYFWQIEQTYYIITDNIISHISDILGNKTKASGKQNGKIYVCVEDLLKILQVLNENDYINIIKSQGRLQSIASFIVVANVLMQLQKDKRFNQELNKLLAQLIVERATEFVNLLDFHQSQHSWTPLQYFTHICNTLCNYIQPIFKIATESPKSIVLSPLYQLTDLFKLIAKFNSNISARTNLMNNFKQNKSNGQKTLQTKPDQLPHLLELESMLQILCCFYVSNQSWNQQTGQYEVCNWSCLCKYLIQKLNMFKMLLEKLSESKPKKKIKGQKGQEQIISNQLSFFNQQIRFAKQVMAKDVEILQLRLLSIKKPEKQEKAVLDEICGILVEFMDSGFDFYSTSSLKMEFKEIKESGQTATKLAYKLYRIADQVRSSQI